MGVAIVAEHRSVNFAGWGGSVKIAGTVLTCASLGCGSKPPRLAKLKLQNHSVALFTARGPTV